MGLKDVATEVGEVSSRRSAESIHLPREKWHRLLAYDPEWAEEFAKAGDEQHARFIIEVMDEILQGETRVEGLTDDDLRNIKNRRDAAVNEAL